MYIAHDCINIFRFFTFDRVDVELTRGEADELKALLEDALARSEHNFLLVGVYKSQ